MFHAERRIKANERMRVHSIFEEFRKAWLDWRITGKEWSDLGYKRNNFKF